MLSSSSTEAPTTEQREQFWGPCGSRFEGVLCPSSSHHGHRDLLPAWWLAPPSVNPLLPTRSKRIMMAASTRGSSATPYSVLPERMSVTHASCELRRVTRFPLMTTVPDHVDAFARLFVPAFDGLTVAVNVPSSLI